MAQIDSFLPNGLLGNGEALSTCTEVHNDGDHAEQPRGDSGVTTRKPDAFFESNGLLSEGFDDVEEDDGRGKGKGKGEETGSGTYRVDLQVTSLASESLYNRFSTRCSADEHNEHSVGNDALFYMQWASVRQCA